jgi:sugar O-acyltransferase (sialic acid O-acetyltransferase NeuD family)
MNNSKKRLILIGGGGHCLSCIDVIESEDQYSISGILDTEDNVGMSILGYKIVGTDKEIPRYVREGCHFLITVGHIGNASLRIRIRIYEQILDHGGILATVVSPRAYIAKSSSIGNGSIIMHDALVNASSRIDENCIINTKALIEHDCHVEEHCHISTSAVINGGVVVGKQTFFGSNAVSKQGLVIDANSFVKANSCFVTSQKKRVAFLTTFFPTEKAYVLDFLESLSSQTVKDFDLIVLNDGFLYFHELKRKFANINIIELPSAGSIAKNRQALIQYAKNKLYDIAIFGDSDDYFSSNRVESSINELRYTDVVVNDLTSIKGNKMISEGIYSHRLQNRQSISFDFIKHKNIFGLSNTAINLKCVPLDFIRFPDDIIAVDWFFYSLLLNRGVKAIFINDVVTFYRQHESNTIGIGLLNSTIVKDILRVKIIHYEYLKAVLPEFEALYLEVSLLSQLVLNESKLNKLLDFNRNNIKYPLWWELVDFRNEK